LKSKRIDDDTLVLAPHFFRSQLSSAWTPVQQIQLSPTTTGHCALLCFFPSFFRPRFPSSFHRWRCFLPNLVCFSFRSMGRSGGDGNPTRVGRKGSRVSSFYPLVTLHACIGGTRIDLHLPPHPRTTNHLRAGSGPNIASHPNSFSTAEIVNVQKNEKTTPTFLHPIESRLFPNLYLKRLLVASECTSRLSSRLARCFLVAVMRW